MAWWRRRRRRRKVSGVGPSLRRLLRLARRRGFGGEGDDPLEQPGGPGDDALLVLVELAGQAFGQPVLFYRSGVVQSAAARGADGDDALPAVGGVRCPVHES